MHRVERHIFEYRQELHNLCCLSKNLYNKANYEIRQNYFKTDKLLNMYDLIKKMTKDKQIDYMAMSAQSSQWTIMLLYKNWKSFLRAMKIWKRHPEKFTRNPSIPTYKNKKNGQNIVIFTNQQCKIRDGYIIFPEKVTLEPLKTKIMGKLQQVRIVPQRSCYVMEVVYEKELDKEVSNGLDKERWLGIDLGVNNLATLVTNVAGERPVLVNGKIVKSINQRWNKKVAELMSYVGKRGTSVRLRHLTFCRNNMIENYMHHVSKYIINYCKEHEIGNIVIGHNTGWKQEMKMGKIGNQKFMCIPYSNLIEKVRYKAEEMGIEVIKNEESYTSKCDALVGESVEKHERYSGKRVKRGLFRSGNGKVVNADVNGALNILRKVIGDSFVREIANKSSVYLPCRVNPLLKKSVIHENNFRGFNIF